MIQGGSENLNLLELFETSVDGIFLLDDECSVLSWNAKMRDLTQVPSTNAIGKSIFKITEQFQSEAFSMPLKAALKNEASISREIIQFKEKDIHVNVQASFSPFHLPNGGNLGCLVVLREQTVSATESRFKPLVEESPIATAIFDTQGKAKYFNRAYGQLWGIDKEVVELIKKSYNILEDKQLIDLGIMPFVQKAYAGESCHIPVIAYNPFNSPALHDIGINIERYIKGHLYPILNSDGTLAEVVVKLSDVTYRHQTEQLLSDNQLKFERLTKGLPGVIYEYEESGSNPNTFRYISQGCETMFGFSPEQVINDASILQTCIHTEDMDSYHKSMADSINGSKVWEWQGRIIANDKVKWIEGKSSSTKLKDGSVVRYGLLLDITEQKKVEDQYKISQERLKIALQGADLGLWEWSADHGKFLHNNSWAEKLGYTYDEFNELLEDRFSLIHPDDVEEYKEMTDQMALSATDVVEVEYRMKTKAGGWLWVRDRGRVLERKENGRLKKASGTLLDIDKSKQTQKLIKQKEQLFTQLFENAPMGVVLLNEDHQVIQMNRGFEDLFGFSKNEVLGKQLNNIIVPGDHLDEAIDINLLTANGTVGILESHRCHKNGTLVPVIIYGVPVSFKEKTIGIYGIYVNITDRVEAERELQIRNHELDNFVYKVSHDLRAPLSSILGVTHLANHESNQDDLHEYIDIIESRVKQLDNFITDVLSHSKNLKMDVEVDRVDFKSLIDNCFAELSYLPNSKNVIRKLAIDPHDFSSDLWRVKELFRNIISNAIKYSDPKKDCSYIAIDIKINKDRAQIQIEDNGIGIEDEALPKIFDMFYRATSSAEGSGIGLYIVKNAVEKLGGKVELTSTVKLGTRFNIILPNASGNEVIK